MEWYGMGLNGWGYLTMAIGMVIFWAVLVVGVMYLVRYLEQGNRFLPAVRATPEQILAGRFARGTIKAQEYRECLDVLRFEQRPLTGSSPASPSGK